MKKQVIVLWDDIYHPSSVCRPAVGELFPASEYEVTEIKLYSEFLQYSGTPSLVVCLASGRPEPDIPQDIPGQKRLAEMVGDGTGLLCVHGGLSGIERDTPIYELTGGCFLYHPEQTEVSLHAWGDKKEKTLVQGPDEHYFCQVEYTKVRPTYRTISRYGIQLGGWTKENGRGKMTCLTPGHNEDIWIQMLPLLREAIDWTMG